MKNFITIILLIFSVINLNSQDSINFDLQRENPKLVFTSAVENALEDFVLEAGKRGFDNMRSELIHSIDSILIVDNFSELYGDDLIGGIPSKHLRSIHLDTIVLRNDKLLKSVMYHEIGHLLKPDKDHQCNRCFHIMSAMEQPMEIILQLDKDDELWSKYLDDFFIWLKEDD